MAASSSNNETTPPQYQVFINFRGDELRNSFVGFLVETMRTKNVNVFIDESEIKGRSLDYLFKRIEESRIAVAIFSKRYTESHWCLDELVKMKEQMEEGKLVVIPVFYKLEPAVCKNLEGDFGGYFKTLA
ncbi:Vesicle-associated protein 1-4 [Cardamine amara subsp. amara]|uniref:Vesicle-associated protein 1-4 n=1 Tax=Cardamine amara subsp. amara TaxID=228776 RepID=A0ABD1C3C9_CARAN